MPVPGASAAGMERTPLREIAAERIRAAIFDGTLLPGEQLNDDALQDWLGMSRTPVREALNELARVGLVETLPQRYTRVTVPDPEDRVAVLQTLGALVGGVVRVTTETLGAAQRARVIEAIDETLVAVSNRDAHAHGQRGWSLVHLFIDACPNAYLVRATRDTIDALAYLLSATRTDATTAWGSLQDGYPRLRVAVIDNDPVAAELAIETVFRLQ